MFTEKQKELLSCFKHDTLQAVNLLEGSVRSGKTWISLVLWAFWVASMPQQNAYLMAAKTLKGLERNCLQPLQSLVGTQHFTYSLAKKSGVLFGRTIYLEGVSDVRAESKIRGLTLQGAYCDELTLFTESFFAMLLSRLSLAKAKLIATTNPDSPNHWLMQNYLRRKDELGWFTMKFLIEDNTTLPPEYVQNLKKAYTGVFYDRFILGLWKVADGLCYQQFADDPTPWLVEAPTEALEFLSIGVDFGGNRSLTTFVATGIHRDFQKMTVVKDYHIAGRKGDIDADRVSREFVGFVQALQTQFPAVPVRYCFADSEAQYLINGLKRACMEAGLYLKIGDSAKHKILERIVCANTLLNLKRLFFCKNCEHVIGGLRSAAWDTKQSVDTRLDNFSSDIDILDAFEYSWERFMPKLLPERK